MAARIARPLMISLCIVGAAIVGLTAWSGRGTIQKPLSLVTGKGLAPIGTAVGVGSYPANMLLSPDGRFLIVTNTGFRQFLTVLDANTGQRRSEISFMGKTGLYFGLAFSPSDPTLLFVSRGTEDIVSNFRLSSDGVLTDAGTSQSIAARIEKPTGPNHIAGLATSSDGRRLYAVANQTYPWTDMVGRLFVVNLETNAVSNMVPLKGFPFAIVAMTKGPGKDRKVYVTSERDGVVSVVDLAARKMIANIETGSNPIGLLLNNDQSRLFVSNAGSDTLSIIDTAKNRVLRTVLLRPAAMAGLPGATPEGMAISPDEKTLYVALADLNAVGVVRLPQGELKGYIPTGWLPTSVAVSPDGKRLFVANAKGTRARDPNSKPVGTWGTYIQNIIEGSVSMIDLTTATADLQNLTAQVLVNNSVDRSLTGKRHPAFKNPGIKHVIYIIKENRTFDQVLGDLPKGNRDASLCLFPREVTPNQHALAERFVLLDNFYVCAEVSADGWNWSTSAMVNEYTSRNTPYNYSGRGRSYDFEGQSNGVPVDLDDIPDVARAPGGYLWDNAKKHKVAYRNYGFFVASDDKADKRGTIYGKDNMPTKKALLDHTCPDFKRYDTAYADSEAWVRWGFEGAPKQLKTYGKYSDPSRLTSWKREYSGYLEKGGMPKLMLVRLGRDHTAGTTAGQSSPKAMVADNDYAVGQIVEMVSNGPYWKKTAICILEDDAQAGIDHVDAHRSTAYVISPYIQRASLDSRFYNTASMIRTIELLLGMPPMNAYDAVAPPFRFFGDQPVNDEPFTATLPAQDIICEVNSPKAYRAKDSERLISRFIEESAPDFELNDILWGSIKGANSPRPKTPGAILGIKDLDD